MANELNKAFAYFETYPLLLLMADIERNKQRIADNIIGSYQALKDIYY